MKLKIFIIVFIQLYIFSSFAQDLERVQKNISILTSKKFHGRGAALNGDALAAEYLAAQFKAIGLKPLTADYYQSFTYGINTFPGKMHLASDKGSFKPGVDYIVRSTCGSGKGTFPLLYIDSLIFTDKNVYADFLKKDLSKVVVVYYKKHFKEFTESSIDLLKQLYSAAAIIELQDTKLTMGLADESYDTPFFEVLAAAFSKDIKTISFEVENEVVSKHLARNVIGYIEGSVKPDSFIVITAHYDHLGTLGNKTYFPGANDNASGVSMLLELAHYYSAYKPAYSMVFIAFAGEESGLIGSSYFVRKPTIELAAIHFLINLDLLGTGDDGIMVVNGSVFKKEYNELVAINEKEQLLPAVKMRGEAANSDHYPFYKRKVPCFFIYTLGGIAAYHDVQDVAKTLPLTKYKEVFKLIVLFVEGQYF
ncbi:M28 family metallopeptidase [Cytophaga aurantiaca]|uniref:M28 family metallopeptidase n=1 Tax=Cytophaga aurantiaca TaxID=29530 RepID=UPI00037DDD45|nr:M28 family peptidase [Cytophaga aurantiaca]